MKKLISAILVFVLLSFTANAAEIYSYTNEKTLVGGVTLKNIKRFYSDYSLNISCITADLKNPHLSLELLKGDNGTDKVETVLNLASKEDGVVAATNADFFSSYKGNQNFSLGIEIKDGELLQSHINSTMAAGFFDGSTLNLSYLDFSAQVVKGEQVFPVSHINKPTDYYGALLLYTPKFNGAVSPFIPSGITVVTVADGAVSAKGVSLGGTVPIPENGYILAIDDNMTPLLDLNFNIGDEVELNVTASPSLDNIEQAFGGGTMLLKDGKKAEITHTVNGNHPRTVIGTNDDGTVIYMLTVDGRQKISRGISLEALSDVCLELGMVNALNLDGGGSTAMVGKPLEDPSLKVLNSPSETRKVINAIAVVSNAVPSEPVGFNIKAESDFVLKKDSVRLLVYAYDKNSMPAQFSNADLSWKVSGAEGEVKGNTFYPYTGGSAQLDLYYKNKLVNTIFVNVIDTVCGINALPDYKLSAGESGALKAEVFDIHGNTAPVNNISLLNPSYDASLIKIDEGKITLLKSGSTIVKLSHSGAVRNIGINAESLEIPESVTDDSLLSKRNDGEKLNVLPSSPAKTLFDRILYSHTSKLLASSGKLAMPGGENIPSLNHGLTTPILTESFSQTVIGNAKIVSLNTSNESLRTDGQWDKLSEVLKSTQEKNLILLLNSSPDFKDSLEKSVFYDLLSDASKEKNIFVVYNGKENYTVIYNGVRYISLAGREDYPSLSSGVNEMKYLSFNIAPSGITYSSENLFKSNTGGKYAIILE